ncbi:polysaccharide biosynthesis tyrosine autokinase [Sphingomonas sp.]|uniref:GumC family protein n=1 Tax=Sphingomonas sp. TaxID=28214 RepID=UPI003340750A
MNKETNEIIAAGAGGQSRGLQHAIAGNLFGAAEASAESTNQITTREALRVLGKWRWLIAGIVGAALIIGIVSTMLTSKRYRATAQVELALQEINLGPGKDGTGGESQVMRDPQFMGTQIGLLRSRDLSERVARSLDGASRAKFAPNAGNPAAQIAAATGAIAGGLRIDVVTGSRLINITYESDDPALAANVANAVADNYIASNLERKYESSAFARKFLEQRLTQTKAALEKSERDVVEYAGREKIVMVGGGADQGGGKDGGESLEGSTLTSLNGALATAQAERIAAEQKYRSEGTSAGQSAAMTSSAVSGLKSERAKLQVDFQEKLGTFKPDYPEMVAIKTRMRELNRQIARAEGEITGSVTNSYAGEYRAALGREQQLRARVAQLTSGVLDLRNRQIQYNILSREVDTNRSLYDGLLQRFKQVSVAGGVGASQVSIVDRALVPGGPFAPNLRNNLLVSLLIGFMIGAGVAFAIEFIDDTIKNPDDVRNRLHLTLLGVVPSVAKGMTMLEALDDPSSAQSEAYLSTRTAIKFTTAGGAPKSLLVTSSQAAEGKSSSCFAIARGFARLGESVLLIDADMRKPSFSVPTGAEGAGLSSLLASTDDLRKHITQTSVPNLFLLPSGPIPPNPVELLGGMRLREVLAEAEGIFDIVIFDSPPVMGLADAPILASVVDASIFVVQAGRIRRPAALRALARLEQAGARVVGGVITKFDLKGASYGYGYGYGYGYSYGQKQIKSVEAGAQRQISIEKE